MKYFSNGIFVKLNHYSFNILKFLETPFTMLVLLHFVRIVKFIRNNFVEKCEAQSTDAHVYLSGSVHSLGMSNRSQLYWRCCVSNNIVWTLFSWLLIIISYKWWKQRELWQHIIKCRKYEMEHIWTSGRRSLIIHSGAAWDHTTGILKM